MLILTRIKLALFVAAGALFLAALLVFLTSFFLLLTPFMLVSCFFLPSSQIIAMNTAKLIDKVTNLFEEKWKQDHDELFGDE